MPQGVQPPMYWLGVDLSERYSAAVLIDEGGSFMDGWTSDFGSKDTHHSHLIGNMLDWAEEIWSVCAPFQPFVTLEDTPSQVLNPKPAMRLSGALLATMRLSWGVLPLIVNPGVWQSELGFKTWQRVNGFGGKGSGRVTSKQRKAFAKAYAISHGYTPTAHYAKQREDLADAFCLARYGWEKTRSVVADQKTG